MIAQRGNKRRQQFTGCAHPSSERGAVQIDAFAREDLGLSIQRQVVPVLGHQHMSQKRRCSQATLDGPRRCGRFNHALAVVAGELRPHMADHLEGCRDTFQLLADIFSELAQRTTATRAAVVLGHVHDDFAGKIFRQGLAPRASARTARRVCLCVLIFGGLFGSFASLQLFKLQLQLFEFAGELLTLGPEQHPPKLLNDQLQMLDLKRVRASFSDQQRLQGLLVERVQINQRCVGHAPSMPRGSVETINKSPHEYRRLLHLPIRQPAHRRCARGDASRCLPAAWKAVRD